MQWQSSETTCKWDGRWAIKDKEIIIYEGLLSSRHVAVLFTLSHHETAISSSFYKQGIRSSERFSNSSKGTLLANDGAEILNSRQRTDSNTCFLSVITCCDCVTSRKGSGACAVRQLAKDVREHRDFWSRTRNCIG